VKTKQALRIRHRSTVKKKQPRRFRTEAALQVACVKYARGLGVVAIKLSMMGRFGTSGWPDFLLLFPGGKVWFCEFKMPGQKPTELQRTRMCELRIRGFYVTVEDSYEKFVARFDERLDAA
jgi:hypothetical protein